jgi:hypothetical protein
MIITELGSMHYDSESKLFSGSLTVQQDTFDAEHPMPPNPGVVGVHVNLKDSSYSLLALQELPLTITNDPSYGLVKVAARSLDPASPGGEPWIALDFCDSSGTKLFSRYGQGDPTLDSNLTALGGISPASYKLKYMPPWGGSTPVWYPNAADAASAETVTVVAARENQFCCTICFPSPSPSPWPVPAAVAWPLPHPA